MANENFKIVSGASIYNIRNIFNTFIEALSESGVANIIANPELTETFFDSNQQSVVAGWDINGIANTTGRYVELNTGEYFRQDIADMVHLGDVYTLSVTLNNQGAGRLRVWNTETLVNPNDKRVYEWDPGLGIGGNLPEIVVPAAPIDATSGQQYHQTVQMPFILHETLKSSKLYIEFVSDEDGNQITVETVSCVKGIFAFSDARGEALFTHSVRYRSDVGEGWWEVTYDNADTWHRLLTASAEDVARITADLATSFYTKAESDAKYLKRAGDTATGLIDLNQGALVGNRFEVKNGVTAKFLNKDVVFNGGDTGTSRFTLYVYSANAANPLLTYVPGFGWHYQNEDGILRPFGSGGGGGGTGDANSEAEFYAEILQHCGYKYVAFDSFSFADTVYNTPNVKYDSDLGAFYIDPTGGGTQAIITKNVFDSTRAAELSDYREWFVVPLTDKTNNEGMDCFYSLTTDVPGGFPTINHSGWTPFDYTQEQLAPISIDEIYFKFTWADESVKFYSYGYFYGYWPFDDIGPNLAMQQVSQPSSDISIGTPVTLPNGATYAIGENSLEIYVNRAKMVEGIDYNEINESQISFTFPIYAGDIIEYIERYTYIDVSQDNNILLQNHINDESIHGLDETTYSQLLTHLDDTSVHGFDLADFATKAEVAQNAADSTDYTNDVAADLTAHIGAIADAHDADSITFNPTDTSSIDATTVQGAIVQLESAVVTGGGSLTPGTSGYAILPGGLVIQWVTVAAGYATGQTGSWPTTWPNNICFGGVCSVTDVGLAATNTHFGVTATAANWTVYRGADNAQQMFIIALGR